MHATPLTFIGASVSWGKLRSAVTTWQPLGVVSTISVRAPFLNTIRLSSSIHHTEETDVAAIDLDEANLILDILHRFQEELGAISDAGDRLKQSRSPEVDEYRRRLVNVKGELKNAAKSGTLDGVKRPQTELERCFYGPAVQHAAAHFRLRTDAPPSMWLSGLYDPAGDVSYYTHGLRKLVDEGQII